MKTIGKIITGLAIVSLFISYTQLIPVAFTNESLADYIQNHMIREIIFGSTLAIWTLLFLFKPLSHHTFKYIAILGSVIVLPFWVGFLFGWSTDGIDAVWGDSVAPKASYIYHAVQTVIFYLGLLLLWTQCRKT